MTGGARPLGIAARSLNHEVPIITRAVRPAVRSNISVYNARLYAATNEIGDFKISPRKQVTIRNDDGKVKWGDLTTREKAARTTQQTFNFGIVMAGLIGTIGVIYFLYTEVFASGSKTSHFNRAVDRIRSDPRALELLGRDKTIRAFGEPTANKWTRNRPIAATTATDQTGLEHFRMHFNVQGSLKGGVVHVHMVRGLGNNDWQYRTLALDVEGHPRLYLENADSVQSKQKPGVRMFGIKWK